LKSRLTVVKEVTAAEGDIVLFIDDSRSLVLAVAVLWMQQIF
jgi:hypothetical protein